MLDRNLPFFPSISKSRLIIWPLIMYEYGFSKIYLGMKSDEVIKCFGETARIYGRVALYPEKKWNITIKMVGTILLILINIIYFCVIITIRRLYL
jgi:hypothetical protein